jgi:large subunit ribosomal protein L25
MSQQFKLNVAARAQTGRSASRRLRKANRVPAILYGKHTSPEKLSIDRSGVHPPAEVRQPVGPFSLSWHARTRPTRPCPSSRRVQRDPITDKYLHVDLQEVKADEKFEIRVPVPVVGESFGVKNQSGVLEIATHSSPHPLLAEGSARGHQHRRHRAEGR